MSDPLPLPEPERRPRPDPEHSLVPRAPRTLGGAVYLTVLGVTALGLLLVLLGPWRTGLTAMGAALVVGGLARLVLPDHRAGMLRLRRKSIDVATLLALGAGLVVLATVIPNRPA